MHYSSLIAGAPELLSHLPRTADIFLAYRGTVTELMVAHGAGGERIHTQPLHWRSIYGRHIRITSWWCRRSTHTELVGSLDLDRRFFCHWQMNGLWLQYAPKQTSHIRVHDCSYNCTSSIIYIHTLDHALGAMFTLRSLRTYFLTCLKAISSILP